MSSFSNLYTTVLPRERTVLSRRCWASTPYSPKYCPSCITLICSPSRSSTRAAPDSRKYIPSGSSSMVQMLSSLLNWMRMRRERMSASSAWAARSVPRPKKCLRKSSSITWAMGTPPL